MKFIQGHSSSKVPEKLEYGTLRLNGLHKDQPPAFISARWHESPQYYILYKKLETPECTVFN